MPSLRQYWDRFSLELALQRDLKRQIRKCDGHRVVAGMATMPSRLHTFRWAFRSIVRQVDHIYVYLDGFPEVPQSIKSHPKVTAILSREAPHLHANGKLLGLKRDAGQEVVFVCVDDDIFFPSDFIQEMRAALRRYEDNAIVGLHGSVLMPCESSPYENRKGIAHYQATLDTDVPVDILGTGAVMFKASRLDVDVSEWGKVSMADLGVAIAAAVAGLPLICVARKKSLAITLEQGQADSLYRARRSHPEFQTELCKRLLAIKEKNPVRHSPAEKW